MRKVSFRNLGAHKVRLVLTVISVIPATLLFIYLWPRYSKDRPGDPAPAPIEEQPVNQPSGR